MSTAHGTRDSIIDFLQQTSYMLQSITQVSQKLNEAKAGKALVESQGDADHALKIASHIVDTQRQLDSLTGVLTGRCKVTTLEQAETLLKDVNERMKLAEEAHGQWRATAAALQVGLKSGTITGDEREGLERQAERAAKQYDTSVTLAAELVPPPSLLVHTPARLHRV